jgi:hypothetical protein
MPHVRAVLGEVCAARVTSAQATVALMGIDHLAS